MKLSEYPRLIIYKFEQDTCYFPGRCTVMSTVFVACEKEKWKSATMIFLHNAVQ